MALQSANDIELWQKVQQSDTAAYELLYRRYMRVLYAAIYKWIENQAEAEDILQDVFLDVWERRNNISLRGEVFNYLYAVTRNKVFDHIRRQKLSERQLQLWSEIIEEQVDHLRSDEVNAESFDEFIAGEFEQLPPQMKKVYELRFRQKISIQDIADQMEISPYTVKNHLKKIRQRLQTAADRLLSVLFTTPLYLGLPGYMLLCYQIINWPEAVNLE
jgi:RNA polymerase sigma-70 factor, ECF subfamily